jgi:hypothetical protein
MAALMAQMQAQGMDMSSLAGMAGGGAPGGGPISQMEDGDDSDDEMPALEEEAPAAN